jgi:hypothetical protein
MSRPRKTNKEEPKHLWKEVHFEPKVGRLIMFPSWVNLVLTLIILTNLEYQYHLIFCRKVCLYDISKRQISSIRKCNIL